MNASLPNFTVDDSLQSVYEIDFYFEVATPDDVLIRDFHRPEAFSTLRSYELLKTQVEDDDPDAPARYKDFSLRLVFSRNTSGETIEGYFEVELSTYKINPDTGAMELFESGSVDFGVTHTYAPDTVSEDDVDAMNAATEHLEDAYAVDASDPDSIDGAEAEFERNQALVDVVKDEVQGLISGLRLFDFPASDGMLETIILIKSGGNRQVAGILQEFKDKQKRIEKLSAETDRCRAKATEYRNAADALLAKEREAYDKEHGGAEDPEHPFEKSPKCSRMYDKAEDYDRRADRYEADKEASVADLQRLSDTYGVSTEKSDSDNAKAIKDKLFPSMENQTLGQMVKDKMNQFKEQMNEVTKGVNNLAVSMQVLLVEPQGAVVGTPAGPGAVTMNMVQVFGSLKRLNAAVSALITPIMLALENARFLGLPASVVAPLKKIAGVIIAIDTFTKS